MIYLVLFGIYIYTQLLFLYQIKKLYIYKYNEQDKLLGITICNDTRFNKKKNNNSEK
jgi:hypothetical protein